MPMTLHPYIRLLAESGQITRCDREPLTALDRSFWAFLGFLLGLAVAWFVQ